MVRLKGKKLPIDAHKRLQIVRDVKADGARNNNEGIRSSLQPLANASSDSTAHIRFDSHSNKKKPNIPIGDVVSDALYDDGTAADFVLPQYYVRHVKTICGNGDPTNNYIADSDDICWIQTIMATSINQNNQKPVNMQWFTIDIFEDIIDVLERVTSLQKEPIGLSTAVQAIRDSLGDCKEINQHSAILKSIHAYWIKKRGSLQKPLCRKFWPQTQPSDLNPHHVFRPRDKEPYRLRKNIRKNDIECFRKMQHIRREFQQAQTLLQLVCEREMLNEADFDLKENRFQQEMKSCGFNKDLLSLNEAQRQVSNTRNTIDSCDKIEEEPSIPNNIKHHRYSPKYGHLFIPLPSVNSSSSEDSLSAIQDVSNGHSKDFGNINEQNVHSATKFSVEDSLDVTASSTSTVIARKRKRPQKSVTIDLGNNRINTFSPDAAIEIGSSVHRNQLKTSLASKSASLNGQQMLDTQLQGCLLENEVIEFPSARKIVDIAKVVEQLPLLQLKKKDLPIPEGRLNQYANSRTPHFLDSLETRDKVPMIHSYAEYLRDLEFRENDSIPNQYRIRSRIGRGGRIIHDRIPIYDTLYTLSAHNQDNSTNGQIAKSNKDSLLYPSFSYNSYRPSGQTLASFATVKRKSTSQRNMSSKDSLHFSSKLPHANMAINSRFNEIASSLLVPGDTNFQAENHKKWTISTSHDEAVSESSIDTEFTFVGRPLESSCHLKMTQPIDRAALPNSYHMRKQAILDCRDSDDDFSRTANESNFSHDNNPYKLQV